MTFQRLILIAIVVAAGLALVLSSGCGPKDTGTPETSVTATEEVTYTVPAGELDNPEGKPVYVCPMEEHKDQVSLDPDARCQLCGMKLVRLEEAQAVWRAAAGRE